MKQILLLGIISISLNCFALNKKHITDIRTSYSSDTTVLPQILSLNLQSYIGKPVDSLFSSLPSGYSGRGFMPFGIGYAKGVYQSYGVLETNNCSVQIFIDNFQHLSFPNRTKTTNWDMGLAKKEIISYIKVFKNNKCIYNCTNANYYD